MGDYGTCTSCGCQVEERSTTQDYRIKDRIVMVIEDVPTGVCVSCGGQFFRQAVLARMEALAMKREALRRVQYVPVVPFSQTTAPASSA